MLSATYQLPLSQLSAPIRYQELATKLNLPLGGRAPLADVRAAVLELRTAKGMVLDAADHDTWSAGSFFLNPIVDRPPAQATAWQLEQGGWKVSAAWLIEASGCHRGFGLNARATLSSKHTLAITNRGGASAEDVLDLARHIQGRVRATFGIELEFEPQVIE